MLCIDTSEYFLPSWIRRHISISKPAKKDKNVYSGTTLKLRSAVFCFFFVFLSAGTRLRSREYFEWLSVAGNLSTEEDVGRHQQRSNVALLLYPSIARHSDRSVAVSSSSSSSFFVLRVFEYLHKWTFQSLVHLVWNYLNCFLVCNFCSSIHDT